MSKQQQRKNRQDSPGPRYKRNNKIVERNIENTYFLVNPEIEEIYYLNSLSSAIWQLLVQPIRIEEVADIIIKAFQNIPPEQILDDTARLFEDLLNKDIVRRCD